MSQLAKEIVEEIKALDNRVFVDRLVGTNAVDDRNETVESIIAAKLEPVRDALAGMLGEYAHKDPSGGGLLDLLTTGEDIMKVKAALALLSEEE